MDWRPGTAAMPGYRRPSFRLPCRMQRRHPCVFWQLISAEYHRYKDSNGGDRPAIFELDGAMVAAGAAEPLIRRVDRLECGRFGGGLVDDLGKMQLFLKAKNNVGFWKGWGGERMPLIGCRVAQRRFARIPMPISRMCVWRRWRTRQAHACVIVA